MIWATRTGCHVDRAACAWLIRRSIDPEPTFIFVGDPGDVPEGATPFDMRGADLSHHGDDCTFETMFRRPGSGPKAVGARSRGRRMERRGRHNHGVPLEPLEGFNVCPSSRSASPGRAAPAVSPLPTTTV